MSMVYVARDLFLPDGVGEHTAFYRQKRYNKGGERNA